MNEREAFTALLVRAIEQGDPAGNELPHATRRAVSADAARRSRIEESATPARIDRFIAERAQALLPTARAALPTLALWTDPPRWRWALPVILAVVLLLGIASNALGDPKRLNLLTAPIAFFIVWNVAIYVYLAARWIARVMRSSSLTNTARVARLTSGLTTSIARWRTVRAAEPVRRAVTDWIAHGGALHGARAALAWHLAAAVLAVGAILGMYLRGLGVDYTAMWESTFLDERAVHRVLQVLLGLGAALLGTTVPDADQLAALRLRDGIGGERAGRWIHLYAASAIALIVLPRLALAMIETIAIRKLVRAFPLALDDDYFRRLVAVGGARSRRVTFVPCGVTPDAALEERVRIGLEHVLGVPVEARFAAPVRYGESLPPATTHEADTTAGDRVLVFSLATTPEHEVHGALFAGPREAPRPLAVLIDELSFQQRVRGDTTMQRRMQERRDAWRAYLARYGIEPVFVPADSLGPAVPSAPSTTATTRS